jgi:ATP-dependent exoDNAse (exonuclease V) alpha subunit
MHHPLSQYVSLRRIALPTLAIMLVICAPDLAIAQTSPFLTGASSLQTNARVAREYLIALPVELPHEHRRDLVRGFSQELADRYKFAVDAAIHAPRDFPGSDPRNFHAHLLATTREVGIEGLGAKTTLEWNDASRREIGLEPAINELLHVRQRWATVTNEALRDAAVSARIDHRTLQAQGIDREPGLHIPRAAFEMERHGYRSALAERLREEYQARVTAKIHNPEEIRRQARENWLRMRQARDTGSHLETDRAADDDLAQ